MMHVAYRDEESCPVFVRFSACSSAVNVYFLLIFVQLKTMKPGLNTAKE
jgi:hypothetical protein